MVLSLKTIKICGLIGKTNCFLKNKQGSTEKTTKLQSTQYSQLPKSRYCTFPFQFV